MLKVLEGLKDVEGSRRVLDEARDDDGKRKRMVRVWRRRGRGWWMDFIL